MVIFTIPPDLEGQIGKPASQAIIGMARSLVDLIEEEKKDVISRIDEKVTARYADIQRRSHEDVAGVELRLSKRMEDLETALRKDIAGVELRLLHRIVEGEEKLAALETRVNDRIGALEVRINDRIGALEVRVNDRINALEVRLGDRMNALETRMIRWMVSLLIVSVVFMGGIGWITKHYL